MDNTDRDHSWPTTCIHGTIYEYPHFFYNFQHFQHSPPKADKSDLQEKLRSRNRTEIKNKILWTLQIDWNYHHISSLEHKSPQLYNASDISRLSACDKVIIRHIICSRLIYSGFNTVTGVIDSRTLVHGQRCSLEQYILKS